jgi:protein gp37
MSDKTTIEWTDATFNAWAGCTKIALIEKEKRVGR